MRVGMRYLSGPCLTQNSKQGAVVVTNEMFKNIPEYETLREAKRILRNMYALRSAEQCAKLADLLEERERVIAERREARA